MANTTINHEVREGLMPADHSGMMYSDRGGAGYRCKIYKALLDITSESDCATRTLVDRSGRWPGQHPRKAISGKTSTN